MKRHIRLPGIRTKSFSDSDNLGNDFSSDCVEVHSSDRGRKINLSFFGELPFRGLSIANYSITHTQCANGYPMVFKTRFEININARVHLDSSLNLLYSIAGKKNLKLRVVDSGTNAFTARVVDTMPYTESNSIDIPVELLTRVIFEFTGGPLPIRYIYR